MLFLLQKNQILQYESDYSKDVQFFIFLKWPSENLLKEQKKACDSVHTISIWKAEQILIEGSIIFIDTAEFSSSKGLRDLTKCGQVDGIHTVFGTSI